MSMIGHLKRITPDDLLKIQNEPACVKKLLRGGYDMKAAIADRIKGNASPQRDAMEAAYARSEQIREEIIRTPGRAPGPFTLEEMKRITQPLSDVGAFGNEDDVLTLEKSWHTLHYLLAGSAEPVDSPLGHAILGGKEIGPDLGYGPARFLSPDEVREVAGAIKKLSKDNLAQRFDLQAMTASEIYACRDESELELAQDYFEQMKQFYIEAASRGNAMLLYLE